VAFCRSRTVTAVRAANYVSFSQSAGYGPYANFFRFETIMIVVSNSPTKETVSQPHLQHVGVIVPTFNAAAYWPAFQKALDVQGLHPHQVLIVDSSSTDGTPELAQKAGYRLRRIAKQDFSHGATRQMACRLLPAATKLVFMTQDAILESAQSISILCSALDDETVGAAYGRQVPRNDADPIERYARLFNYPATSATRTFESRDTLGIKAVFFSNSFAVYRRRALEAVGGFPLNVILAEDSIVAARMLMAGWKTVYQADAVVIHSHPIELRREFSRYFDTGVHHAREAWLLETFGGAGQEGMRFVRSELSFLWSTAPSKIPLAILRTLNKYAAYQLGRREHSLPLSLRRKISDYPNFWSKRPVLISDEVSSKASRANGINLATPRQMKSKSRPIPYQDGKKSR
jgi:rhamnosyltransferase